MTDIPGSGDQSRLSYDSLEEFIFGTSRNTDNESELTVRIYQWQYDVSKTIADEILTGKTTVLNRAYMVGLKDMRLSLPRLSDLTNLHMELRSFIGSGFTQDNVYRYYVDNHVNSFVDVSNYMDVQYKSKPDVKMRMRDSVIAEVTDKYTDVIVPFHRHVLAFGFRHSEYILPPELERCEVCISAFEESLGEYIHIFEKMVAESVSMSLTGGDYSNAHEALSALENMVEMMNTDWVSQIEEAIDIIEDGRKRQ